MNIFDRVIDGNTLRILNEGKEKTFKVEMTLSTPDFLVNEGAIIDILRLLSWGKCNVEVNDINVSEVVEIEEPLFSGSEGTDAAGNKGPAETNESKVDNND